MKNMKSLLKIGLIMGSFDPIHIGHLDLVRKALESGMDKILIVPCAKNPWKSGPVASLKDRCEIIRIALSEMFPGEVIVEPGGDEKDLLDKDGNSWAYIQLDRVVGKYGEAEYYIIGGTDIGNTVMKWKNWSLIQDMFNLLIVDRGGYKDTPETLQIQASSSLIRDILKKGNDPRPYILRSEYNYIKERKIYE